MLFLALDLSAANIWAKNLIFASFIVKMAPPKVYQNLVHFVQFFASPQIFFISTKRAKNAVFLLKQAQMKAADWSKGLFFSELFKGGGSERLPCLDLQFAKQVEVIPIIRGLLLSTAQPPPPQCRRLAVAAHDDTAASPGRMRPSISVGGLSLWPHPNQLTAFLSFFTGWLDINLDGITKALRICGCL